MDLPLKVRPLNLSYIIPLIQKTKTMKLYCFFLLFTLIVAGCGSGLEKVPVKKGWQRTEESDFAISYPNDWQYQKADDWMVSKVFWLKPDTAYIYDDKIDVIEYNVARTMDGTDLDDFVKDLSHDAKNRGLQMLVNVRMTNAGEEFRRIILTEHKDGVEFLYMMNIWVYKEKSYALTYKVKKDHFHLTVDLVKEIFESFRFNLTD